mgnify:CR=1 FL=1
MILRLFYFCYKKLFKNCFFDDNFVLKKEFPERKRGRKRRNKVRDISWFLENYSFSRHFISEISLFSLSFSLSIYLFFIPKIVPDKNKISKSESLLFWALVFIFIRNTRVCALADNEYCSGIRFRAKESEKKLVV